ncbi:MAG: SMI1/KNR4 family protein [Clostridium sp.]|nr:SMI1/KNR4 family protein [Clostridium sp.]
MNTIKNEFDEIVKLCEEKVEEYGERASYFLEPATEEEILEWERETGIQIPEDYRQWLKLTGTCQICSNIASLVFPETKQPDFLPDDYVLIGYVVGDGEVLCFSKSTGKYITYFEGKVNRTYDDFMMILYGIKKSIKGEAPKIKFTEDKIRAMMAELEEIRKNKGEIR